MKMKEGMQMGIGDGFSPTFGFKVDPDNLQDRKSGEAIPRKMTPEEIVKYGAIGVPYKKPSMVGVENMKRKEKDTDMKKPKINEQKLIEICNEHGFTSKAYNIAASEFGVEVSSIKNYIAKNKLNHATQPESGTVQEESKAEGKSEIVSSSNDELEIIGKIRYIVEKNQVLKDENKFLKESLVKVKSALDDILNSIA